MLLKHLFSINCQITVAYRAIHSLHFHHLWVRLTVNYIIPPHMWIRHTEKCGSATFRIFLFGGSATFLLTVAFRATKISTTLRADVPVAIRATRSLKDTMLPVNYRSWQRIFSKLPKTFQQWELPFLLNAVAFRATKIPTTFGAEFPVAFRATLSLEGTMLPVNCQSYQSDSLWTRHI